MGKHTDEQIADAVTRLKLGEALTRETFEAVADGINRKILELEEAWGKQYPTGGSIKLRNEQLLVFSRNKGFEVANARNENDRRRLTSASVDRRVEAIESLPRLIEVLEEYAKVKGSQLLNAFDSISQFAQEAIDD